MIFDFIPWHALNRTLAEHLMKSRRRQRADVCNKGPVGGERLNGAVPHNLILIAESQLNAARPKDMRILRIVHPDFQQHKSACGWSIQPQYSGIWGLLGYRKLE